MRHPREWLCQHLVQDLFVISFQVIAALAAATQITDLFHCIKLCVLDGKDIYGADVTGPAINLIALVSVSQVYQSQQFMIVALQ